MTQVSSPRERLLDTARELFYREGIHTVGVDRLVSEAQVTRATFYRHFPTKEALVVAYLNATDADLRAAVQRAAASGTTDGAVLAVLDLVGHTLRTEGFRGCHFVNAAAEYPGPDDAVRAAVLTHRRWFEATLRKLAKQAGHPDAHYAAAVLVLLHDGALSSGSLDNPRSVQKTLHRAVRQLLTPPADAF